MSFRHLTRVRVRSYELDIMGHVNNATYLHWLEHARLEALETLGYRLEGLIDRRWMTTVARIEVDYRAEARFGDLIELSTEVERIGTSSIALRHRMVRAAGDEAGRSAERDSGEAGGVVAEARVVVVWLGPDRRPAPVPDPLRERLKAAEGDHAAPADPGGDPGGARA